MISTLSIFQVDGVDVMDAEFSKLQFTARMRDLVALMLITSHEEKAAAAAGSPATTTAAVTDAREEVGAGFETGRRTNFGASENIASSIWHSASKLSGEVMLHSGYVTAKPSMLLKVGAVR